MAKLPKSVLKARAHKSTSDIPLDLLLAGELRPPPGSAVVGLDCFILHCCGQPGIPLDYAAARMWLC